MHLVQTWNEWGEGTPKIHTQAKEALQLNFTKDLAGPSTSLFLLEFFLPQSGFGETDLFPCQAGTHISLQNKVSLSPSKGGVSLKHLQFRLCSSLQELCFSRRDQSAGPNKVVHVRRECCQ
jgi:hypothetical protein